MLQLADLLSWDAKCNRVLHDLVVSCYGAPGKRSDSSVLIITHFLSSYTRANFARDVLIRFDSIHNESICLKIILIIRIEQKDV